MALSFAELLTQQISRPPINLPLAPVSQSTDFTNEPAPIPIPALELDPSQQEALHGLLQHKYSCLIGQAGTGKTTVLLRVLQALEAQNYPEGTINFVSFTGRATQMLKKALPLNKHKHVKTIHSLLEYAPETVEVFDEELGYAVEKRLFMPRRTKPYPLTTQCIIIDEAGMTPTDLWNNLIEALPLQCKIILVGDINQLPPAFGSSVLAYALNKWASYTLTTIHRQAWDSAIIQTATTILNGNTPQPVGQGSNSTRLVKLAREPLLAQRQTKASIAELHRLKLFDPKQDIIITPTNEGMIGQTPLNEWAARYFNPNEQRHIIRAGMNTRLLAKGDKVMALANDLQTGVTNGMLGYINDIVLNGMALAAVDLTDFHLSVEEAIGSSFDDLEATNGYYDRQCTHNTDIDFVIDSKNADGSALQTAKKQVYSTIGDYTNLSHGYACTCHKAQGGEYRNVIIICHSAGGQLLTREWLYTAVTRAKERVWIFYDDRGLRNAVNRQRIKGQDLPSKLAHFIAKNRGNEAPMLLQED